MVRTYRDGFLTCVHEDVRLEMVDPAYMPSHPRHSGSDNARENICACAFRVGDIERRTSYLTEK